jgi:hypothetical protein
LTVENDDKTFSLMLLIGIERGPFAVVGGIGITILMAAAFVIHLRVKNPAFKMLPCVTLLVLCSAILKYHVVPGKVLAAVVKTMEAKTVEGQSLKLVVSAEGVTVDNAKVVKTDVMAENGVIHAIDTVIIPKA